MNRVSFITLLLILSSLVGFTIGGTCIGSAASFSGSSFGSWTIDASLSPKPFTIEFSLRLTSFPTVKKGFDGTGTSGAFGMPLVTAYNPSSSSMYGWGIFLSGSTLNLNFIKTGPGISTIGWEMGGGNYTLGSWVHVAFTVNAASGAEFAALYVDGELIQTTNPSGYYVSMTSAPAASFGKDDVQTLGFPKFSGWLDELRGWKAVLTQQTIRDWSNKPVTNQHPNYSNLKYSFAFDTQIRDFVSSNTWSDASGTTAFVPCASIPTPTPQPAANFQVSTPTPTPIPQPTSQVATSTPTSASASAYWRSATWFDSALPLRLTNHLTSTLRVIGHFDIQSKYKCVLTFFYSRPGIAVSTTTVRYGDWLMCSGWEIKGVRPEVVVGVSEKATLSVREVSSDSELLFNGNSQVIPIAVEPIVGSLCANP